MNQPKLVARSITEMDSFRPEYPYAEVLIHSPRWFGCRSGMEHRIQHHHLMLWFYDADPVAEPSIRAERIQGITCAEWSMQREQADAIVHFVCDERRQGRVVVICCERGVSRSPSIAMALADGFGWERSCIDDPMNAVRGRPPNLHCYAEIRAAIGRMEGGQK